MNCPRCNHSFEGDTCPICYTKVVPLNQNNASAAFVQNEAVKTCASCRHEFVGIYCPLCGSNSYVKPNNVAYNINGGKCLRCGGVTNTNICPHCGYTHPVSSGYVGANNNGYANQGQQYQNNQGNGGYGYSQPIQKKMSMVLPIVMVVFACILCFSTVALLVFSVVDFGQGKATIQPPDINGVIPPVINNTEMVNYPDGVSLEEYKKVKVGMEYAQVSAIIGGDGQIISNEKGDSKKTVYAWYGQNVQGAVITITFEDNKVVKVEQQNLF